MSHGPLNNLNCSEMSLMASRLVWAYSQLMPLGLIAALVASSLLFLPLATPHYNNIVHTYVHTYMHIQHIII